jgi:hypothetical protein
MGYSRCLSKLAQETHFPWQKLLPLVLIQLRKTPNKMGLTPFEALYVRPFLQKDFILEPEVTNLVSHITHLARFQQVLSEVGREELQGLSPAAFCPGGLVLIKLPHNSQGLPEAPWEGPTRSCYLPPQELRSPGWTPGFTSPKPNDGHLSLTHPPWSHTLLHQPTPVSQQKTSNIFSKGASSRTRNLCLHFLPFCGLCLEQATCELPISQALSELT